MCVCVFVYVHVCVFNCTHLIRVYINWVYIMCFSDIFVSANYKTYFSVCRMTSDGHDYIGTEDKTISGTSCVNWTDPYLPMVNETNDFGEITQFREPHNYCRNPSRNGTSPWCYIKSENSYVPENCDIPMCG